MRNIIKINNKEIQENLFLIIYMLFSIMRVINNSLIQYKLSGNFTLIMHWIILISLICLFLCRRKYSGFNIVIILGIGILSILIYLFNRNVDFLCIIFFLLNAFEFSTIEKLVKCSIVTNVIMLITVFSLCYVGVIRDLTYSHFSFAGISYAHSYGFVYYSNAQFIILFASAMYLYLRHNWRSFLLTSIINVGAYFIFTAYLPLIAFFIMMFLIIMQEKTSFYRKCSKIIIVSPYIIGLLSLVLSAFYNSNSAFYLIIDKILNTRISQAHTGLIKYGPSLFGKKIEMYGSYMMTYGGAAANHHNFFIDNDYMYILLSYGVIFFILILVIYSLMLKVFIKQNMRYAVVWTLMTLIFSFVNSALISIDINPILIVGVSTIWNSDRILVNQPKALNEKTDIIN